MQFENNATHYVNHYDSLKCFVTISKIKAGAFVTVFLDLSKIFPKMFSQSLSFLWFFQNLSDWEIFLRNFKTVAMGPRISLALATSLHKKLGRNPTMTQRTVGHLTHSYEDCKSIRTHFHHSVSRSATHTMYNWVFLSPMHKRSLSTARRQAARQCGDLVHGASQKSANSLVHFSVDEMCSGSSSYVSKLLGSPGPFDFGKNGASTCCIIVSWQHIISTVWQ